MKLSHRIFALSFALLSSLAIAFAQENRTFFLHTVEKGQSLYSISTMYGVKVADIVRLNPGCEEKIYAGKTLKIPQKAAAGRQEVFHTIRAGETLYKLTVLYRVSAKEICSANPGLSAANFQIGQVIRIPLTAAEADSTAARRPGRDTVTIAKAVQPRCKEMHKVKRRETIFSVSREYGISEQELIDANPELKKGMKRGQLLCIPYPKATPAVPADHPAAPGVPPTNNELFAENVQNARPISTIRAAIVLPFHEDKRMVEYYEGFLMAVDSLKRTGTSVDLYVYDSGKSTESLNKVLQRNELESMNVIFGPMHSEQIKPLSEFAQKKNIRLVVPFSQKGKEVFNNPYIYQINTPQSYLYSEVYSHFLRQFPNAQVIFIEPATPDTSKKEFVSGLKTELKRHNIGTRTVSENATKDELKNLLRPDKQNIFLPTSGNNILLIKALPQLTLLVRENPEADIQLFGYPEWQTYTRDHLESFFELNTYFYSSFYTNTLFPAAVRFANAYHHWYTKDLESKYPNYAMLGYDTGFFFLKGLSLHGSNLENEVRKMNVTPIQTGFKFERVNNWGGFINKKVFFIHFTKNFELEKLDFE